MVRIKIFFTLFVLVLNLNTLAQNSYTISGFVEEKKSGESLIGVSIYENKSQKGTITNQDGFYSLTLP